MTRSLLIAASALGLLGPLGSLSPLTPSRAASPDAAVQQTAAGQEQIRGDTRDLEARLDDVIDEYTRNGLATGEDFEVLKDVRAALGSLSEDEMQKVVALLKEAAMKPDRAPGQIVQAYAGQKEISLKMKQILAEHQREQDVAALAQAVSDLADRQTANLGAAADVKQLASEDDSDNGKAAVNASEEGQQSEQGSIAGEVKLLADKLAHIAADASQAGEPKYNGPAAQLAKAQPQAASAGAALGAGHIDDAITGESAVQVQLVEVARALAPGSRQQSAAADAALHWLPWPRSSAPFSARPRNPTIRSTDLRPGRRPPPPARH